MPLIRAGLSPNDLAVLTNPSMISGGVGYTDSRDGGVAATYAASLASGRPTFFLVSLRAGAIVGNIRFMSGSTAGATLTHVWYTLADLSRNKLAVTADDTAASWAANTSKTLAIASPYVVPSTGQYYVGVVVVGTTMPTFQGNNSTAGSGNTPAPIRAGTSSTTGLTTPASAPSTYGALTAIGGVAIADLTA